MAWTAHRVVLRLCSPMHIGMGKVGNLQRTRPYVTGRNLWGALTARLTRDAHPKGKPLPQAYAETGKRVHAESAFSYFYPTTRPDEAVDLWPWEHGFRWRFLSTYASTALHYGRASAEEASLHEVECLIPHARPGPRDRAGARGPHPAASPAVYLVGYIFERKGASLRWRSGLRRLQIGGERGYGWGRVQPVGDPVPAEEVFGYQLELGGARPVVTVPQGGRLLAHTLAVDSEAAEGDTGMAVAAGVVDGRVEPLVGRETRPTSGFGKQLSQARVTYAPGSRAARRLTVGIGPFGVWEGIP